MMQKIDSTSLLFDLNLFSNKRDSLLKIFENWLFDNHHHLKIIYTPNSEQIIQSLKNHQFKQALQRADVLLPDGIGLVAAARLLNFFHQAKPITERIAGVEVVMALLALAKERALEVLVIGGRDYSPTDYFAYNQAKINWTAGFKNVLHPTITEKQALKKLIASIQPAIILVAFGAPDQELWIDQHRLLLAQYQVKLAMTVGGSFDYLLNKVPRAPGWMSGLGLEWFFRLMVEPWRFNRQLRLLAFIGLTFKTILLGFKKSILKTFKKNT